MNLGNELAKWKDLRAQLENVDDMDDLTMFDTLDGETNLTDILLHIDDEIQERQSHVEALGIRIGELTARKARHQKAIDTLRTVILRAMDCAGIKKIEGPAATLSVSSLGPVVEIVSEADIPAKFWITGDPKLDKTKLNQALETGPVPGVRLGNGRINLTIRRT